MGYDRDDLFSPAAASPRADSDTTPMSRPHPCEECARGRPSTRLRMRWDYDGVILEQDAIRFRDRAEWERAAGRDASLAAWAVSFASDGSVLALEPPASVRRGIPLGRMWDLGAG